jgi:peptide/nickel transport system substrate-binding protein
VIALETGAADVISHIPAADVTRLMTDPEIEVLRTVSIGARGFRFHMKREPFTDPRVRQAISAAIDRRAIVENLFPGQAKPSTGALTPIMRGYANLGEIPHDPRRARQLLAEAGYPEGFSMTISTTARYILGVELAEAVAAQLAEVGITCDIEVIEWGTFITKYRGLRPEDNPMEMFIWGAGASTADADWGLRPLFFTHPTNENNYGYYSNAEFDELITSAMRETEADRRQALYRRAQEILYVEDPGAVWLFDLYFVIATRAGVQDVSQSPLGIVTFEHATVVR